MGRCPHTGMTEIRKLIFSGPYNHWLELKYVITVYEEVLLHKHFIFYTCKTGHPIFALKIGFWGFFFRKKY